MGLADFFGTSTGNVPGATANTTTANDGDVGELVRRLTRENMELQERNRQLEESYRAAIGARKGAVERVRELEDILRLKEGIFETLEKEINNLQRQNGQLQLKEQELFALRLEQEEHPLSASDAEHRFDQLADVFSQLKDTLACPVCYEPFQKDQAISMSCGHTFCAPCYRSWEERHIEAFKLSPQQGAYIGPECPECRLPDPRRGKVRIWALEEIVRLVDRAQRNIASKPYTPAFSAPPPAPPAPASKTAVPTDRAIAPIELEGFPAQTEATEEEDGQHALPVEEDVEAREAWAEEAAVNPLRRSSVSTLAENRMVVEPAAEETEGVEPQPALVLERERRAY
ncbi:hypothetical protein JCM11251_002478 [Rhodosporidiobolus azoricus]